MLALRDTVLLEWEKRVRAAVEGAGALSHPVLIEALPVFYDKLVESVAPDFPRSSVVETTTLAMEHGGERARVTPYDPQDLIREYQLFRETIFDVLKANGVRLQDQEQRAIDAAIDAAIREAVTAFALIQSALQEQFVATLSHDLRTPLAAASVAAELILHAKDLDKAKELANRIRANNERMDRMLQEMLDTVLFQKGERLRLTLARFDILELLREVLDQAEATHGRRFHLAGGPVCGWWDRDALKRALENLVGNAVKYGAPGTPISIKAEEMHGRLVLSVHNIGLPIPADEMESVFQIFRRTKAAKQGGKRGWGVGLPYVRAVAESHGGGMAVDSTAEQGTTFLLDIPLDARPFQDAPSVHGSR